MNQQVSRIEDSLKDIPLREFEGNWILRSMAERAMQVAAEIVIDVAERILAIENSGPASSAAEAIESLLRLGVLKSAQPYVDIVRFRNLIVHQDEEIDPVLLFDLAKHRLNDFRAFRAEIDDAG